MVYTVQSALMVFRLYKGLDDTEWRKLEIPSMQPRMAVVEPVVASDSAGSFAEGTLVLMMFDPEQDTGQYRCEAEYVTTSVGTNMTYVRAEYTVSGNGE